MKRLFFVAALLASTCSAFAGQHQTSTSISGARSSSNNRLVNSGNSSNRVSSSNRLNAASSGNSTSFNSAGIAPGLAGIGGVPGTNVCTTSAGLTGSGLFGGGGFSFPWENHQCDHRQGALVLHALGQNAAAIQMMCEDDDMAEALVASGKRCYTGHYAKH